MMRIKRLGVLAMGKMLGLLYAGFGLIIGGFFSLFALLGAAFSLAGSGSGEAFFGLLFGIGAVVILPLIYGFMGFIGGLIIAVLYNIVAGVAGGIELEVG